MDRHHRHRTLAFTDELEPRSWLTSIGFTADRGTVRADDRTRLVVLL